MGCFGFNSKRTVPDDSSPDNLTELKVAIKSSSLSPRSDSGSTSSSRGAVRLPSLGSFGSQKFGGQPQPLPSPSLIKFDIYSPGKLKSADVAVSLNSPASDCKKTDVPNNLTCFAFRDLESITNRFSAELFLGAGGFGSVYKGCVSDSRSSRTASVAIKVLNVDGHQGENEWLTEVKFLGKLHHPNLVRLVGYCAHENQRLLVYKYMAGGSLEMVLFEKTAPLPWTQRIKIALGAARGLQYLHEETEQQIIYRDFKTSNILLDKNYEAKLSDFGLARCGPEGDATHVTTRVVGTVGYAAPEYVTTGHLTVKSDVWGFGVVLLELLTGRISMDMNRPDGERNLVEWAEPILAQPSKLYKIMDPELAGRYSVKGAQRTAALILKCLQRKPKSRPRMSEVVRTLEPLLELQDMAGFSMEELEAFSREQ